MTTPKGPATEGVLGELHQKVAKVLINALDNVITTQEAGGVTAGADGDMVEIPLNPALLSVAIKFLDSNKITCAPEAGNAMSDLERKLKDRQATRRQVGNVVHLEQED